MEANPYAALIQPYISKATPGLAVGIVHRGQVIHAQGYGIANLEWQCPVTRVTVFHLGSVTKPFTALAIMRFVEQGKIDVAAPVTTYVLDYPMHGAPITIAHLLSHTSGIPNYVASPHFWEKESRTPRTPQELRELYQNLPLDFPPGTRYHYSNSGYCLLGVVLETVTGKPYEEVLRTEIFDVLDMKQAVLVHDECVIPNHASGYDLRVPGEFVHPAYLSMTLPYAAGGLAASLADMLQWEAGLRENRLLPETLMARMATPTSLNNGETEDYGFGWGVSSYRGRNT